MQISRCRLRSVLLSFSRAGEQQTGPDWGLTLSCLQRPGALGLCCRPLTATSIVTRYYVLEGVGPADAGEEAAVTSDGSDIDAQAAGAGPRDRTSRYDSSAACPASDQTFRPRHAPAPFHASC